MSLTLSEIRATLVEHLKLTIEGREVNVYAYDEGEATPYVSLMLDAPPEYTNTFGHPGDGLCLSSVRFRVKIVPGNTDESAIRRLDDFLSAGPDNPSSVAGALLAADIPGMTLDVEPGLYDQVGIEADLIVTVSVL